MHQAEGLAPSACVIRYALYMKPQTRMPGELLPLDARCEACLYSIAGLPMKGKCPECGNKYGFEYLYRRGSLSKETCSKCRYALKGLALRGNCPECGEGYRFDAPKRERPAAGWGGVWRWFTDRLPRFDFKIAFVLLILVTAIFLGLTGWTAFRKFYNRFFVEPQGIMIIWTSASCR